MKYARVHTHAHTSPAMAAIALCNNDDNIIAEQPTIEPRDSRLLN